MKPIVYDIAGFNGACKTTFASRHLQQFAGCRKFVKADLIAAGPSPFNPESQSAAAGRLMLELIAELTAARISLGFETTLTGRGHARRLRAMKPKFGYRVSIVLHLASVSRPSRRSCCDSRQRGGHNFPEPTIRRR